MINEKRTLCRTRTYNLAIRSRTRYPIAPIGQKTPDEGLEPSTTRLKVVRSTN